MTEAEIGVLGSDKKDKEYLNKFPGSIKNLYYFRARYQYDFESECVEENQTMIFLINHPPRCYGRRRTDMSKRTTSLKRSSRSCVRLTFCTARAARSRTRPADWRERSDVLSLAQGNGGMKTDQLKRLKELEKENKRLSCRLRQNPIRLVSRVTF